ncbi:MAG: hypothetical protein AAF548_08835 [Actinomycetota bacterium]
MAIRDELASRSVDADAVDAMADAEKTLLVGVPVGTTKKGRTKKRYELRVRRHRTAKRFAGMLSVLIVAAGARWYLTAAEWRDPCGDADPGVICDQPAAWFRVSQYGLAVIGVVTGLTIATYLGRFALTGKIWRRSREVSLAHGTVVLAWLVVWAVGAVAR